MFLAREEEVAAGVDGGQQEEDEERPPQDRRSKSSRDLLEGKVRIRLVGWKRIPPGEQAPTGGGDEAEQPEHAIGGGQGQSTRGPTRISVLPPENLRHPNPPRSRAAASAR